MPQGQDIAAFIEWHRVRVLRKTGKAPSRNTLRTKASRIRVCMDIAHLTELCDLGTLIQDRDRVESLLDGLAARMTSGSASAAFYALGSFGDYAKAQGWCQSVALMPSDRPPSNPQKPITVYSPEELQAILSASLGRGVRWWAFLHTMASTGRRVGEVLALEWVWLNLSAEVPHINLPTTKNGKQAYVPLGSFLREEVFTEAHIAEMKAETRVGAQRQYGRDPQEFIFPWTHTCVSKMLERYCRTIGVECRGFHCFRHTKATELLARGVPIQAVSALLGHSSVATTDRIYNHATALSYANYVD